MKKLVFATNNSHKLEEVRAILSGEISIASLAEIGCGSDIAETGATLQENAEIKAQFVAEKFGVAALADDTGLEVAALNGAPGVYSARYAGEDCDSEKNVEKLLNALKGEKNRAAQFRTVIALIDGEETHFFQGIVTGRIAEKPSGDGGFGYDSVFIPDGFERTFAEFSAQEKNQISHRARALAELKLFLKK